MSEASLFSLRCAARSLDDREKLQPLAERLEAILRLTGRAEFACGLDGEPGERSARIAGGGRAAGNVCLGDVGQPSISAYSTYNRDCFAGTCSALCPYNCFIRPSRRAETASLDEVLHDSGIDSVSHCITLSDFREATQVILTHEASQIHRVQQLTSKFSRRTSIASQMRPNSFMKWQTFQCPMR